MPETGGSRRSSIPSRGPGTRTAFEHLDDDLCRSFQRSIEMVGRKWTAVVLMAGLQGARRFSEYRARVPGISDRLLAQRLRELEHERLLARHVAPTTPVLITYLPTERAIGLMEVLGPLVEWSVLDQESDRGDHGSAG